MSSITDFPARGRITAVADGKVTYTRAEPEKPAHDIGRPAVKPPGAAP